MRALFSWPMALLRGPVASAGMRALTALCALLAALCCVPSAAAASSAMRTVIYRGARLRIPASWPVFNLARHPTTCVRFNRHAVYLGQPSADERCPTAALGRTEAILLQPLARASQRSALAPRAPQAAAQPRAGSVAVIAQPRRGVLITATWAHNPGLVRAILRDPSIGRQPGAGHWQAAPPMARALSATAGRPRAARATTYTGLGFDSCSAPSSQQLSDWQASPFRAFGIYIGGTNMACAQTNLSAAYLSQEVAAGWHLIPTYVGLQAPGNSCGCAAIDPAQASAEGTAAAQDAVSDAQALGITTGNPIYFDMEAYGRGGSATQAVLQFLAAWTAELHAQGYLSGVYVNDDSGVPDLVGQWGSGYLEPDELWVADWDGQQSTYDAQVPSGEWASHQRIHQYRGGHNDNYGGATINIDSDYVDAATVGQGGVVAASAPAPTLAIAPQVGGPIRLSASWTGVAGIVGWRLLGGDEPQLLAPLTGVQPTGLISTRDALAYFAAQAIGSSGQVLGTSAVTPTPAHLVIYGASAFVPAHAGPAGIPVGCFSTASCRVRAQISSGRTLIASTGWQRIAPDQGGFVDFTPSAAARRLLDGASGHRLAVQVSLADSVGLKASTRMTLIPFTASGRGPARRSYPAATLRAVGFSDFVSATGTGGLLAACTQPAACAVRAQLVAAGVRIASTGREYIGAHQLGYVIFHLSPRGRALLAAAPGNQLAAEVTLADESATARATIALIGFQ